jgi:4-hydroxybenzoate polyprenyltransferase
VPARFGVRAALRVAAVLHAGCLVAFAALRPLAGLGPFYASALLLAGALLVVEHAIVSPTDLRRVNVSFFTLNGLVALALGAGGIVDALS